MAVGMTFTGGKRWRDEAWRIGHLLLISGLLFGELVGSAYGAGSEESALPDAFRSEDLLWEARLGTHQYTMPRIDGGRVFIGINDLELKHPAVKRTGGGIVMCLDAADGRMIWQLPIPRYMKGVEPPYHFNQWKCGVCSRPAIDGKYLYIVGPRGDVLCLDRNGQGDGNDGPFRSEAEYMGVRPDAGYELTENDGDIVWRFDLIKEVAVVPHDVCGSTPLLHGDYLYACTSNGQDDLHKTVPSPLAPSLIVLDKRTGRLVAADGELIGKRMFHGHWSSPIATRINERDIILFGGGDGILYAFEPLDSSKVGDEVQTLKKVWQHDCNPPDYRQRDGRDIPYANHTNKSPDGPSEIIAAPVVHGGRIYIAIGQSPIHGPGQGMLSCLDAATGRKIWESRRVDRSIVNAAIHDGLVYIPDFSGRLHCLDADTGEYCWQHDLEGGAWTASPVVVNGKVYVNTENGIMWILKAGREKEVLSRSRLRSVGITPVVQDGVFYLSTQKRLFALKIKNSN